MEPRIQYAKTSDGVSIAFSTSGEGMPLPARAAIPLQKSAPPDLEFRIRAPSSGASRISLTHAADRKLQVVAFRERRQGRVVKCGAVQGFELPLAAGLPGAVLDTCQKVILPEVAGAR